MIKFDVFELSVCVWVRADVAMLVLVLMFTASAGSSRCGARGKDIEIP